MFPCKMAWSLFRQGLFQFLTLFQCLYQLVWLFHENWVARARNVHWLKNQKHFFFYIGAFLARDRSGLWQKKHFKKAPFQGNKSTFLAKKKAPISQTKSTFGAGKKHLVNMILLTKSNKKVLTINPFPTRPFLSISLSSSISFAIKWVIIVNIPLYCTWWLLITLERHMECLTMSITHRGCYICNQLCLFKKLLFFIRMGTIYKWPYFGWILIPDDINV